MSRTKKTEESARIDFRLSQDLYKKIEAIAEEKGLLISGVVRMLLLEHLKDTDK